MLVEVYRPHRVYLYLSATFACAQMGATWTLYARPLDDTSRVCNCVRTSQSIDAKTLLEYILISSNWYMRYRLQTIRVR
jgi:hypothetical protein